MNVIESTLWIHDRLRELEQVKTRLAAVEASEARLAEALEQSLYLLRRSDYEAYANAKDALATRPKGVKDRV